MRFGTSLPQQPEDETQQRGDDQSRRERKVEREAFTLETEIAGQASEAKPREPGPGDADDDEDDTERDEEASHVRSACVGFIPPPLITNCAGARAMPGGARGSTSASICRGRNTLPRPACREESPPK